MAARSAGEVEFTATLKTDPRATLKFNQAIQKMTARQNAELSRANAIQGRNAAKYLGNQLRAMKQTEVASARLAAAQIRDANRVAAAQAKAASAAQQRHLTDSLKLARSEAYNLSGALGGVNGALKALPLQLVTGLAAGLAASATAALGLGTTIASIGLKSASALQNMNLQIQNLGSQLKDISPEQTIGEIRKFAIASGISVDTLSKQIQGFVASGNSGRTALGILEAGLSGLAKAGSLSEGTIKGVNRALLQIQSKPLLQLEELNQLSDQAPALFQRIAIMEKIAAQNGEPMAAVMERFRLGTQQSGEALTAVVAIMADADKEGKALKDRLNTLGGQFDSLKVRANLALGDLFNEQNGPAQSLVDAMKSIDVEALVNEVGRPVADALASLIPVALEALPDIVSALSLSFELLAPLVEASANALGDVTALISEYEPQIRQFAVDLTDFGSGIVSMFEGAAPAIAITASNITAIGDSLSSLGTILEAFGPLWDAFGAAATLNSAFTNSALNAISALLNVITGDLDGMRNALQNLGNTAAGVYNMVAKIVPLLDQVNNGSQMGGRAGNSFPTGNVTDGILAGAKQGLAAASSSMKSAPLSFANTGAGAAGGAAAAKSAQKAAETAAKNFKLSMEKVRKELNEYAKKTSKQTLSQLESNYESVVTSMKAAIDKAGAAGQASTKKALQKQLAVFKKQNKEIMKLAKARDKNLEKLEAAKDALKEVQDFMKGIQDNVTSLGSVMRDTGGIDVTFTGMRNNFRKAILQTKQFAQAINQLRSMGLNETSLRQLAEAGPAEGLRQAMLLARSGQGGVNEINNFQKELEAAGLDLATGLANEFYNGGISAAQGLVAGLESQQDKIVAAMDKIADKLVESIKKKLKIKSPSAVMEDDIMADGVIAGMVRGASRGETRVAQAMDRLASITSNASFGPGSIVVNGIREGREQSAGTNIGGAIAKVLEDRKVAAQLAGVR